MGGLSDGDEVEAVADMLRREFAGSALTAADVRAEVRGVHDRYCNARIRQYVPILVYRETRDELRRKHATGAFPAARP